MARANLTVRGGAAAGLAILAACGAAPVASAGQAGDALVRYRPILRYDSSEQYFAQPVSLPPESADVVAGDRVYGHVAREQGEVWLQYWFFYAYNPQDRGILATGRHQGDWEFVQLRLGADGGPDLATLSQHSWAEGCEANELEHVGTSEIPVLYVANGSHATYPRPGEHDRPFPDPTDEADGRGREVRPPLTEIDDGHPEWVGYEGLWGTTRAGIVPGEASSPRGPRYQEGEAWQRPSSFHERSRGCGSGAPSRPWQTPAAVAALGLVLLAVVWIRRVRNRAGRQR